jgi:hypothetical protein
MKRPCRTGFCYGTFTPKRLQSGSLVRILFVGTAALVRTQAGAMPGAAAGFMGSMVSQDDAGLAA